MSTSRQKAASRGRLVASLLVLGAVATAVVVTAASAQPTPRPLSSRVPAPKREGAPSLPTLGADSASIDVRGKILKSTRGQPGPVRLQVERAGDPKPLEVLVAPNEVCDKLGLSLKSGEEVHLRGSLFAGKNPILVVSSVVVDGKAIAIRSKSAPAGSDGSSAATKKSADSAPNN